MAPTRLVVYVGTGTRCTGIFAHPFLERSPVASGLVPGAAPLRRFSSSAHNCANEANSTRTLFIHSLPTMSPNEEKKQISPTTMLSPSEKVQFGSPPVKSKTVMQPVALFGFSETLVEGDPVSLAVANSLHLEQRKAEADQGELDKKHAESEATKGKCKTEIDLVDSQLRGLDVEWNKCNSDFDANVEELKTARDEYEAKKIEELKQEIENEYLDKLDVIEDQRAGKKVEYEQLKAQGLRTKYEIKQKMNLAEQDAKHYHEERRTNERRIADYKLRKAQVTKLLGVGGEAVDAETLKRHIDRVLPEGLDLADVNFQGLKVALSIMTEDDVKNRYGETGGRDVLVYLCRRLKACNLLGNEDARTAWMEMTSAKRNRIPEDERNGWDTTDPTTFQPKLFASNKAFEMVVDRLVVYLDLDESDRTVDA